jgi:hypothetical protein
MATLPPLIAHIPAGDRGAGHVWKTPLADGSRHRVDAQRHLPEPEAPTSRQTGQARGHECSDAIFPPYLPLCSAAWSPRQRRVQRFASATMCLSADTTLRTRPSTAIGAANITFMMANRRTQAVSGEAMPTDRAPRCVTSSAGSDTDRASEGGRRRRVWSRPHAATAGPIRAARRRRNSAIRIQGW